MKSSQPIDFVDSCLQFFDLSSGYLNRARDNLPKLGDAPWDLPQNVIK